MNIVDDFPDINNELLSNINEVQAAVNEMKDNIGDSEIYGINNKKELKNYNKNLFMGINDYEACLKKQKTKIQTNIKNSKAFIENLQDSFEQVQNIAIKASTSTKKHNIHHSQENKRRRNSLAMHENTVEILKDEIQKIHSDYTSEKSNMKSTNLKLQLELKKHMTRIDELEIDVKSKISNKNKDEHAFDTKTGIDKVEE